MSSVSLADERKIRRAIKGQNKFKLVKAFQRNVLFVGKIRSGKSTAAGVLRNPVFEPPPMSIFAQTTKPRIRSFALRGDGEDDSSHTHTLSVVDTPGLFEVRPLDDDRETRDDDTIIQMIGQCLEYEITKVHCVVMFMSAVAGVNDQDIQAIEKFAQLFLVDPSVPATSAGAEGGAAGAGAAAATAADEADGLEDLELDHGAGAAAATAAVPGDEEEAEGEVEERGTEAVRVRMALCITRAEGEGDQWKEGLRKQLRLHPRIGPLIKEHKMEILFMGAVEAPRQEASEVSLTKKYKAVYNMRKQLLEFIFSSRDFVSLKRLLLANSKRVALQDLAADVCDELSSLSAATPAQWATASVLERRAKVEAACKELRDHSGYLNLQNLSHLPQQVFDALKAFETAQKGKLPDDDVTSLAKLFD